MTRPPVRPRPSPSIPVRPRPFPKGSVMKVVPRIWPETASRRQARAVLSHLVEAMPADTLDDLESRLVLYDAIGDLDDWLPPGALLEPVEPCPGTLLDAYRLLVAAIHEEYTGPPTAEALGARVTVEDAGEAHGPVTARDRVATGLAAGRLRALLGPALLGPAAGEEEPR